MNNRSHLQWPLVLLAMLLVTVMPKAQGWQQAYPSTVGYNVQQLFESNELIVRVKNGLTNANLYVNVATGAQAQFELTAADCDFSAFGSDLQITSDRFFDHAILANGNLRLRYATNIPAPCGSIGTVLFDEEYPLPQAVATTANSVIYNYEQKTVFVGGLLQLSQIGPATQHRYFVKKIDAVTGAQVWEYLSPIMTAPGYPVERRFQLVTGGGGAILSYGGAGNSSGTSLSLLKLDGNGQVVYDKVVGGVLSNLLGMSEAPDGSVLVRYYSASYSGPGDNFRAVKWDASGNQQFSVVAGSLLSAFIGTFQFLVTCDVALQLSNGDVLLAGHKNTNDYYYLSRISPTGQVLWVNVHTGIAPTFSHAIPIASGGFLLGGTWNGEVSLVKTDANGNISAPPTTTCPGNLLTNPGFENGLANWGILEGNPNATSNTVFAGNKSLELGGSLNQAYTVNQAVAATPNTAYTLQLQGRKANTGSYVAQARLKFYSSSWLPLSTQTGFVETNSYQLVTVTATSPPNAAYVGVEFFFVQPAAGDRVFVDEVCLTAGGGSGGCSIVTTIVDKQCYDNSTPNDPSDDLFGFTVNVASSGSGCSTQFTDGSGFSYNYGGGFGYGEFPISSGPYAVTFTDLSNPSVQNTINVQPPATCSNGGNLPDLEPINIQVPASVAVGSAFSVNFSVRNNGNMASSAVTAQIRFDNSSVGINVGTVNIGVVQPGQTIDFTTQVTVPSQVQAGPASINVTVDYLEQLVEINENNNSKGVSFEVTGGGGGSGQIDLSLNLQQLTTSPAQWSNYPVKLTISNAGPQAATGVKLKFAKPNGVVYVGGNEFTASQGSFNPNGDEIWTVGSIPANGSATLTVNYFLLNTSAPVAYAQVTAHNETDSDSQPGNGTPPTPSQDDEASTAGGNLNLPDLTLSTVNFPPTPGGAVAAGTAYSINFLPSNLGGQIPALQLPVSGSFYLSADNVLSANDILIGTSSNVPINGTPQSISGTVPASTLAGQYFAIVQLDPSDTVAESNENNNVSSSGLTITVTGGGNQQPDLTIADLQIPTASVAAGTILSYNFDASNAGTAAVPGNFTIKSYISTDQTLSANDVQDGTIQTGNYAAGFSQNNIPGASTIPASLAAGPYYLIVKIDADNAIAEGNENNNVVVKPFAITSGATVCQGDLILESQAEVNAVPGCAIVNGDLIIRSPNGAQGASSDIADLSPLLGITQINGKIIIENNDQLLDLHGLENITSAHHIAVVFCENIQNVQALSGLSGSLSFGIVMLRNPSLLHVNGLEGITEANHTLTFTNNASLQNLDGLSGLKYVTGLGIDIGENPSLTSIQGLHSLISAGGKLEIQNCDALPNLNGLENLQSADALYLLSNNSLQNVSALGSLTTVQNILNVSGNAQLSDCCIFQGLLSNGSVGSVIFENNAGNCNSAQLILDNCSNTGDPCSSITITPGPNKITIAGFSAPHVLIKVFKPNWQLAFECLDGQCANPTVVTGLGSGSHFVEVKLLNASWGEICKKTQTVGVTNLAAPTDERLRLVLDNFYPNPTAYLINIELYSPKAQAATLDFYNQQGRLVHSMKMPLELGTNTFPLLVNDWYSGTYNVIARGEETGLPAYGRFMKVWEE